MAPGPERTAEPARLQDLQLPSSVNVGDQVRAVALLESASAQTVVATLEIDSEVVQSQNSPSTRQAHPASFVLSRTTRGEPGDSPDCPRVRAG